MVFKGLWPEEQEWLVRKAALAGGLTAVIAALVRQGVGFELAYHELQQARAIGERLARDGILARDARAVGRAARPRAKRLGLTRAQVRA